MVDKHSRSQADSEAEVWNAIAAFEKILEVMPDDRSSLETLSHAYEHIGDQARALTYVLRLAHVVLDEQDADSAAHIIAKLEAFELSDAKTLALLEKLRMLGQSAEPVPPEEASGGGASAPAPAAVALPPPERDAPVRFRVADELSFAWRLYEAGEITQDEYASVAHDLAELSIDGHLSTVSVLHALERKAFSGMERVMGYISRESKTPIISLRAFDIQKDAIKLLSREFMIRRGAMAFGLIKDDAMVVIMNAFDRTLRTDIERATGRKCHFFMGLPDEFDSAIESLESE